MGIKAMGNPAFDGFDVKEAEVPFGRKTRRGFSGISAFLGFVTEKTKQNEFLKMS